MVSEVGSKDQATSDTMAPNKWVSYIQADLDAGAVLVTLETREGGKGGICRSNGELRYGLIEEILSAKINHADLLFEAPSTELQTYFVRRVGPDVNLGNIAVTRRHPAGDHSTRPAQRDAAGLRTRLPRRPLSMRESRDVFHLAIPAYDLDETVEFYVTKMGCKLARRYDDRVTFDFFGDQLVCHLSEAPAHASSHDRVADVSTPLRRDVS